MKYILVVFGVTLLVIGNWPSFVVAYFPYNLLLIFLGGVIAGWFGTKIVFERE